MTALDNLNVSFDHVRAAVEAGAAEIAKLAAAVVAANGNEAALQDLADKFNAEADALSAAVAAAEAPPAP